jgi:hypothetical protein
VLQLREKRQSPAYEGLACCLGQLFSLNQLIHVIQ